MDAYSPVHPSRCETVSIRGLSYQVRRWGANHGRPIWLLHGWMDVSASYQFLADELLQLDPEYSLYAPDWRGFGGSTAPQPCDGYWFADYLADLDALLRHYHPDRPAIDMVAHSMGGNVAMLYAGVRPERVARLVNLDGIGLAGGDAAQAPARRPSTRKAWRHGSRMSPASRSLSPRQPQMPRA